MKRIASIQDLSCIGKCSLGIALPVLSVMGIECAALPTAVLSAHTAFDSFCVRDMTDCLRDVAAQWERMALAFDAVYTGYLASETQVALVQSFADRFGQRLLFVDPVMADHGRLYTGFSDDFPAHMRGLCRRADVITPNVTEACLLTGTEYRERQDEPYLRRLLESLMELGPKTAIVTGLRPDGEHMGVASMEQSGAFSLYPTPYYPSVFHGTGDLFAAACVGALTLGHTPPNAIRFAADYVAETLRVTREDPDARWYGVNFEQTLARLPAMLMKYDTPLKEDLP